jgi:hypothetical protein
MKWHQAHTAWFFETFVLRPFLPGYKPIREEFRWLFNSYYNSIGEAPPDKQLRAGFSRLSLDGVFAFGTHVGEAMEKLFACRIHDDAARRINMASSRIHCVRRTTPTFSRSTRCFSI